jgi:hypothetical protein
MCLRVIDRVRLRQLLIYGLFAAVLATVQDRLVLVHKLWEYRDVGPVSSHAEIALLISLSAAPAFGMRFAQGLLPGARVPWRRIARYTGVAMLPELAGCFTGHIHYYNGWNLFWSVLAYIPIWLSFWGLHRRLTRPQVRSAVRGPGAD